MYVKKIAYVYKEDSFISLFLQRLWLVYLFFSYWCVVYISPISVFYLHINLGSSTVL